MRLWLRVWGVVFALGALDFLVLPRPTVALLNRTGSLLGFSPATTLEQPGFWVPLAAAYMLLIAAFCYEGLRDRRGVRYLLLAKISSSLAALGWFVFGGLEFPFLAAGLVDAAIAAGTFALLRTGGAPVRPAEA